MSKVLKAIGDIGAAAWWGGNLMGILGLNPAVEVLDDPEERGKMVDEGWARYQPYGALGLAAATVSHIVTRRDKPRRPSQCYQTAALVKDVCLGVAIVSSIASVALGEYSTEYEADAYTPMESATTPESETPEPVVAAQKGLSISSWALLISGLGFIAAGAVLSHERER